MATVDYEVEYPDYFDQYAGEIEAKGYFADLTITSEGRQYRPVFYDIVRAIQEIRDEVAADGMFSEASLVILSVVNRAELDKAISRLAAGRFTSLVPEVGVS